MILQDENQMVIDIDVLRLELFMSFPCIYIFSGDVCLNVSSLNLIFKLKIIVTRSTRPVKV